MTRIVAISDTHQLHEQVTLPAGDILVHCGDFTNRGTEGALKSFLTWFSSQPHEYKVFIPGNHEVGLDRGPGRQKKLEIIKSFTDKDSKLVYLENSSAEVNGLKFYGSPVTPWFFDWAWNVHRGMAIASVWENIPDDTQVLLTHGPAYRILDLVDNTFGGLAAHQGCQDLLDRINNLKELKLHAFGHLHLEGGKQVTVEGKVFANAAICDDAYHTVHAPIVVEI